MTWQRDGYHRDECPISLVIHASDPFDRTSRTNPLGLNHPFRDSFKSATWRFSLRYGVEYLKSSCDMSISAIIQDVRLCRIGAKETRVGVRGADKNAG
jgi:hypothetical protein